MTQPLALVCIGRLQIGSRLAEKLESLGYRVQAASSVETIVQEAEAAKPLLAILGLDAQPERVIDVIGRLARNPATEHLPVMAVIPAHNAALQESARQAGAKLAVPDNVVVDYFDQFLDQALDLR